MSFVNLILFFAVAIISVKAIELPPELQEFVDDLHKLCVEKSGISEAEHSAYDIENNPHDTKLQCYMKCLMLESKWMRDDGTIQYDFILSTIHPDIKDLLELALNKCRNIEDGANLCEKASNFNHCMYKADPVNWYLV